MCCADRCQARSARRDRRSSQVMSPTPALSGAGDASGQQCRRRRQGIPLQIQRRWDPNLHKRFPKAALAHLSSSSDTGLPSVSAASAQAAATGRLRRALPPNPPPRRRQRAVTSAASFPSAWQTSSWTSFTAWALLCTAKPPPSSGMHTATCVGAAHAAAVAALGESARTRGG
jgi:hypothetical protein